MLVTGVSYKSERLGFTFFIPDEFTFSPSIPWYARWLVPVTSDIVAASLPHDFLYRVFVKGVTRSMADQIGKEELEHRNVNRHIILRFYYALKVLGWRAWNKNRKLRGRDNDKNHTQQDNFG